MLNLAGAIFKFVLGACELVCTHREIIRSGFAWRVLQFAFFNETAEFVSIFPGCNLLLADSTAILIYLVSFSNKVHSHERISAPIDKKTTCDFWKSI